MKWSVNVMGRIELEMATEALLRLNNMNLLTDQEVIYKLKQAYMQKTTADSIQDSEEPTFEPELSEIPKVQPRSAVLTREPNKDRIEALRRQLR